jgi:hypothetical protein
LTGDHLRGKLATSETAREGLRQTDAAISDELTSKSEALEKMSNNCVRLRDRASNLEKEVRNLRAKALRTPGQRSRAIEVAIAKAANEFKEHSNVWRIKCPDGQIENWVRELSCRLITVRHLPATQTPGAISDILQAIKANTGNHDSANDGDIDPCVNPSERETFSDRSARRFPLEGCIMGEMMAAEKWSQTLLVRKCLAGGIDESNAGG